MIPVMEAFRQEAETLRLARLLSCTPDDLSCLGKLDAAELRMLRLASQHFLLREHRPVLHRLIQASKLLPTALAAAIGEHTLGPLLSARICDQMTAPRIASLCRHLSPAFMGAVSMHMDIDRLAEMAAILPINTVQAITQELVLRREFLTLGELVEFLPRQVIQPVLEQLNDGEAVLRACFFVEQPARLHLILELMPELNLHGVIKAAAEPELDLLPQAMTLIRRVSPLWQRRLVLLALQSSEDVQNELLRGIHRHALWQQALPLLEHLPASSLPRVMRLEGWSNPDLLESLFRSAEAPRLQPLLTALVSAMSVPHDSRSQRLLTDFKERRGLR